MNNAERERLHHMMMAAVDNELSPADRQEFERALGQHPELRQEYEQFRQLKEVTAAMKLQNPPPEVWDTYWIKVYNRLERGLAWILLSLGAIIVLTFGLYQVARQLLADTQLPLLVKLGILGVTAGTVILLVSVIRERLFTSKRDKYKEIQR